MNKFQNKYRTSTVRLKNFNYASNNAYFVTICTKDKINYFGEVAFENRILLSPLGEKAKYFWENIPNHFNNAVLDEFIIMPNHLHGIITIEKSGNQPMVINNKSYRNQFGKPIKASLSVIINHYKGAVKRFCNKQFFEFNWQRGFYERVIRNEMEFEKIREYIYYNPVISMWDIYKIENLRL